MQGVLVLTILTVRSSYLRELEEPLPGVAVNEASDTIQWWIAPTGSWRIRTYAMDHDVHTHWLGSSPKLRELAIASARKHYGDVINAQHVIDLKDASDPCLTAAAFRAAGLEPRVEMAAGRFVFWKPDDASYSTQSQPR